MRYQLLKTSPYLGGQVRWDIPIDYKYSDGEYSTRMDELHIVPLDDSIVFNEGNDWKTFNYSHLENIKHLYEQISGSFFSASGEWSGTNWLYNAGDILDPFSHTYNMGVRHARFKRYGKQFSCLCPIWISEETDVSKLQFEISIKVVGEERDHIVRRRIALSKKIQDYLGEYLNKSARYVEPDPVKYPNPEDAPYMGVNDDLLSIKFDPDYASVTGVRIDSAKYAVCDISYMIPGLLDRELPMMEFDNMLVSKFRESKMIAQQLINLNFFFNMDDISYGLSQELLGQNITLEIRVLYDGQYLELRDFYTNYSDIPVFNTSSAQYETSHNALDYMGDNKIIDYIYTNKFTQPIFHWSMVENPEYIYNFYDGFSPIFEDNGSLCRVSGRYYDQADIAQDIHTPYNNAAYWCKTYDLTGYTPAAESTVISEIKENYKTMASPLIISKETQIAYLNNNRYVWNPGVDLEQAMDQLIGDNQLYLCVLIWDNPTSPSQQPSYELYHDEHCPENLYILITNSKFWSTLRKWANEDINGEDVTKITLLSSILDYLSSKWIPPYKIPFRKTTVTEIVKPFSGYHPQELEMYKLNLYDNYILRYTGALCPRFISPNDEIFKNKSFYYKQWGNINDTNVQEYNKLIKTGEPANYPSIDYYSLIPIDDTLDIPEWYSENWPWEVIWKSKGNIYILPEKYNITIEVDVNSITDDMMWNYLYEYFDHIGIQTTDSLWMKHKLKNLYNMSYVFDYLDEYTVDRVIYNITFELQ